MAKRECTRFEKDDEYSRANRNVLKSSRENDEVFLRTYVDRMKRSVASEKDNRLTDLLTEMRDEKEKK